MKKKKIGKYLGKYFRNTVFPRKLHKVCSLGCSLVDPWVKS